MNYIALFEGLNPHFFEKEYIRSLPAEESFVEQILLLNQFSPDAVDIPCPEHITFGLLEGSLEELHKAVAQVDEEWVQYFGEGSPVFCAFDGQKIAAFCTMDDWGTHQGLRVSGPGCVGTVPAYRKQGIGLKMVQLATAYLKQQGFDLSYIHYTYLESWYARLGYETIIRWNCQGIQWVREK